MRKLNLAFNVLVVMLVLSALPLISAHTGEEEFDGGMMDGFGNGMMSGSWGYGFMWIFGWIFMILVIVALVLFIIWLVRELTKKDSGRKGK